MGIAGRELVDVTHVVEPHERKVGKAEVVVEARLDVLDGASRRTR